MNQNTLCTKQLTMCLLIMQLPSPTLHDQFSANQLPEYQSEPLQVITHQTCETSGDLFYNKVVQFDIL